MTVAKEGFHPIKRAGEVISAIGYGFRWAGYIAAKGAIFVGASVPGAAAVAEVVNAGARIKGYDVLPGFIDQAGSYASTLQDGSIPEQAAGLVLGAQIAAIEVAHAGSEWGGDVMGVIASHAGDAAGVVDTIGDMSVDLAVAGAAGYGAVKIAQHGPSMPQR